MEKTNRYTLKNIFSAFSMIMIVLLVRLVDEYLYDMKTWAGAILVVFLVAVIYKIINSFPKLNREITKRTNIALNAFSLAIIFILFYSFTL